MDAGKHGLILHVVLDQHGVNLFLYRDSTSVADLKAFHAKLTAHDGQDLGLLIADVNHEPRG